MMKFLLPFLLLASIASGQTTERAWTTNTNYNMSGITDPTLVPINALQSTTYYNNNGNIYVKLDDGFTTHWAKITGGGGGGGVTTVGAIDGFGAAANALAISGTSIFAQSASATNPGMVNNTTQTFSGNKTISGTGGGQVNALTLTSTANTTLLIKNTGSGTSGLFVGNNGGATANYQINNLDAGTLTFISAGGLFAGSTLDMGSHQIHTVTDPTSAQDAATKNYVDTHGTPSGTANSLAYFNNSGALSSNASALFTDSSNSLLITTGAFSLSGSSGAGSIAAGTGIQNNAQLVSNAAGTYAHGASQDGGRIYATGTGADAGGYAHTGNGSAIVAEANGAKAFGEGFNTGLISASATGSMAFGFTNSSFGSNATIQTTGAGSMAGGQVEGAGTIISSGLGAAALGHSDNNMLASGPGAIAHGYASGGSMTSSGDGSLAQGFSRAGHQITASGNGAMASGEAFDGDIIASGSGSVAWGSVQIGAGSTNVSGAGSVGMGDGTVVSAAFAQAFGIGQSNSSYNSMVIGSYGVDAGSSGSWVLTDPLFAVGNGLSSGATNNALTILKSGHIHVTQVTPPGISACGTSPSLTGTDVAGKATVGTGGVATSCTITFNQAWSSAPICFVNDESAIIAVQAVPTTTTLTLSATLAFAASTVLDYHCIAN